MGFYLAKYTGLFEWKLAVGVYIISMGSASMSDLRRTVFPVLSPFIYAKMPPPGTWT